jgi:hypothetical protein
LESCDWSCGTGAANAAPMLKSEPRANESNFLFMIVLLSERVSNKKDDGVPAGLCCDAVKVNTFPMANFRDGERIICGKVPE